MQVAKISTQGVKYTNYNVQNQRKIPFSGFSHDSFVWHNSKYAQFKNASDKIKSTPGLVTRHLTGSFLNKIEGLQYGVRTFESTPIKEVYHIMKKAGSLELGLVRGCTNGCKHCYVGAKPPIKDDDEHISKMSFENFLLFTNDFREMKERFKLSYPNSYVAFFRDSDCKDVYLTDYQGREHSYQEIGRIFYNATGIRSVFDTAGWNAKDIETQRRMEELVEYYSKDGKMNEIYSMSVSVNPFGNIISHANDLMLQGRHKEAKEVRDIYIKNMANVFFTFTPLIKSKKFSVIGLALPYSADGAKEKGYNIESYNKIVRDIVKELERMYWVDYYGERRVIKKKSQIESNCNQVKSLCSDPKTKIGKSGHDNGFYYNKETPRYNHSEIKDKFNVFIDTNGEVYLTKLGDTYKTTTHLDFQHKNKKTLPIRPEPKETINLQKFYP